MGIKGKAFLPPAGAIASAAILIAGLAACAELPRDPNGTTERVRRTHAIVLGEIAGAPPSRHAEQVLDRVAGRLGAHVRRVDGHGEDLLKRLEKGEVDLVYGHFAKASPWSRQVHFGTPLGRRRNVDKQEQVPRFAFRNGENGWIALVEGEIR
ncbi:hypothetical protein [Pelagerythrobacter rhizovicinus]|uniref:ABC transporter substrate-binding protein n=1 Tax=Pelagerythrobacter rhizovicinus TaxID=2268576 RepID=A0A4Q2KJL7_9SPHN|nr:hypothetical protein [Pelagerythrobacter rhizovicinus]RXZ64517.1 hypothetical protein ETX26_11545 [Pelagerythrobacter rhizovicinus]